MIDRYEVGERQTSACGIPTEWLEALDLMGSHRQTFPELVVHTPHGTTRLDLPFTFSTFDYPTLCQELFEQSDCDFETAKVDGRTGDTVHTDRGDLTAPADRRRASAGGGCWARATSRPTPRSRAGSRCTRTAAATTWRSGSTASTCPAGYGWSFPARDELRIGVGSFDPRFHVKDNTVKLADDLEADAVRYQGNWIPHKIRSAVDDGVFFAGDSAGHCIPLTAEGIRTALLLRPGLRPRAARR